MKKQYEYSLKEGEPILCVNTSANNINDKYFM